VPAALRCVRRLCGAVGRRRHSRAQQQSAQIVRNLTNAESMEACRAGEVRLRHLRQRPQHSRRWGAARARWQSGSRSHSVTHLGVEVVPRRLALAASGVLEGVCVPVLERHHGLQVPRILTALPQVRCTTTVQPCRMGSKRTTRSPVPHPRSAAAPAAVGR
jgi:hypothetical protein